MLTCDDCHALFRPYHDRWPRKIRARSSSVSPHLPDTRVEHRHKDVENSRIARPSNRRGRDRGTRAPQSQTCETRGHARNIIDEKYRDHAITGKKSRPPRPQIEGVCAKSAQIMRRWAPIWGRGGRGAKFAPRMRRRSVEISHALGASIRSFSRFFVPTARLVLSPFRRLVALLRVLLPMVPVAPDVMPHE